MGFNSAFKGLNMCAFAWNIEEVSDVEECTQWKTLKCRNISFTDN